MSSLLRRWDAAETRYAASHAFRNRVVERVGPGAPSGRSAPVFSPWFGRAAAAAAVIAAAIYPTANADLVIDMLTRKFTAVMRAHDE